jgi:hypothetical protein
MEFTMTEPNDTKMRAYDQLMQVRRCIDALKDVSENMPEDDGHCAVLGIISERLYSEYMKLMPFVLSNFSDNIEELSLDSLT